MRPATTAKMHVAVAPHNHSSRYMYPTPSCRLAYDLHTHPPSKKMPGLLARRICAKGSPLAN